MNQPPVAQPSRPVITALTEVLLIASCTVVIGRIAYDGLKPPPPPPLPPLVGGMVWTSSAGNNGATFDFTNLSRDVRVACLKGVVTAKESRVSIASNVVCTGEVKPNTSVRVEALWPKGRPDDICYKENQFGKLLDWSKCDFTHEDVAPVLGPEPTAPPTASK